MSVFVSKCVKWEVCKCFLPLRLPCEGKEQLGVAFWRCIFNEEPRLFNWSCCGECRALTPGAQRASCRKTASSCRWRAKSCLEALSFPLEGRSLTERENHRLSPSIKLTLWSSHAVSTALGLYRWLCWYRMTALKRRRKKNNCGPNGYCLEDDSSTEGGWRFAVPNGASGQVWHLKMSFGPKLKHQNILDAKSDEVMLRLCI